jgi:acetyl esterase
MPLHPVAIQMLADSAASGRPNAHLLPVDEARVNFEGDLGALSKPEIAETRDMQIPTRDDAEVPARLYLPTTSEGPLPVVVYFHGGGWLLGSVDSHDVTTRRLALASGCAVLSVGYRRGPEHRFPTAVHDAVDAVRWVASGGLGDAAVPDRVAVAGDSAGGNLATVATQVLRDEGGPTPRLQLLVYPVTSCDLDSGFDMTYEGHILYRDEMQWHQDNYLTSAEERTNPLVSPLLADLAGLPPAAVVVAECDPLRPQGLQYVEALRRAGVLVDVFDAGTLVHGFFGLDEVFPEAARAMEFAGAHVAAAMA